MQLRVKQLVATLLLTACSAACPSLHAQNAADPHWLLKYRGTDGTTNANMLMWNKNFKPFINHYLPQRPVFHGWGRPEPMGTIAAELFGNSWGATVYSDNARFFAADGCEAHACFEKGLLWVDLGSNPPLVAFAVMDVENGNDTQAEKLHVFTSRKIGVGDIPPNLRDAIARWTATPESAGGTIEKISRAVIVDPGGQEIGVDLNAVGVAQIAQEKPE